MKVLWNQCSLRSGWPQSYLCWSDKKTVRICGDFSQTVNKAAQVDAYPIPKIGDLFTRVAPGAKKISILDLSQAYQQVQLDEQSKKYVVITTHRGLFQYNRLPYGHVSVCNGKLTGPGVMVYIVDILITGKNDKEHLATLEKVIECLDKAGRNAISWCPQLSILAIELICKDCIQLKRSWEQSKMPQNPGMWGSWKYIWACCRITPVSFLTWRQPY